jgi:hypothetical protein
LSSAVVNRAPRPSQSGGATRTPYAPLGCSFGNPVSFDAIDILTIRGGLIREHRVVVDQLALMKQIGAL